MSRIFTRDCIGKVGEIVELAGWVNTRRDHGKLIFIDLRDRSGLLQLVFTPLDSNLHKSAEALRSEWVIRVVGIVKERPSAMRNEDIETGGIELEAKKLEILSASETPPFEISGPGYEIDEAVRLKYRYLDLRRERLQKNLRVRHRVIQYIRNFLTDRGFVEIETPILSKSTPEGARDYLVPSRLHTGKFYALPQSPQQYKQLLMVAGFERYFQIPRCFRDEDTRGDRQPEFTQLDLEMSFTNQEEVLGITEELYTGLVKDLFPEKKIGKFERLTFKETMDKYGTDKPDLRRGKNDPDELAFVFITDFAMFEKKEDGSLGAVHHPFTLPSTDTSLDPERFQRDQFPEFNDLMEKLGTEEEALKLVAYQYDFVCNGYEIGGGSIRIHNRKLLAKVFERLGNSSSEIESQFGHILSAFDYGVPPHGGIAPGIDRFIMILQNEPNIREVIAFPKTGDARDLMMDAPSEVSMEQQEELGISIKNKK